MLELGKMVGFVENIDAEIDYGGVRNVLAALGGRSVRISLMTAIGVTNREGDYNRQTEAHDWKRRGERLVRVSGLPYTIVRPGWFDTTSQTNIDLYSSRAIAGMPATPATGIARRQLAEVLVASLTSVGALRKSFELVATQGKAQPDLESKFARLDGALPAHWTRFTTWRTCRCRTSRTECDTTWKRRAAELERFLALHTEQRHSHGERRRCHRSRPDRPGHRAPGRSREAHRARRPQRGQRERGSRGHGQRWLPSERRDRRRILARGVLALVGKATAIGEIVGLIHAAGVSPSQASPETVLHVDLYGTAVVLEEFGKVMARGGSGVVISSQSGHRLPPLTTEQNKALAMTPTEALLKLPFLQLDQVKDSLHAYQLSKRGNSLRVMAEAVRCGKRGARINTISPGIVMTPLAKDELAGPRGAGYRRMIEGSVAKRAGTPDEVGAVGALLMGPDGGFITGSDFLMDGGVTAASGTATSRKCARHRCGTWRTAMEMTKSGSQPSAKGPADWFTGAVRIDSRFQREAPARTGGATVTFEPGARTAWHTHPLGQTLLVIAGCGRVQRDGGPIEEIRAGDIVWFEPGERHWHGASPTTAMTHIAIAEMLDDKVVEWMEHVTDQQYGG